MAMAGAGCVVRRVDDGARRPALSTRTGQAGAPLPPTCAAPLVLEPPPDKLIDAAGRQRPLDAGGAWTRAMQGPYDTRDDAAPHCRDRVALPAATPFEAIVHCATGDRKRKPGAGNLAQHTLLVRTARGWWSQELVRDQLPRRSSDELRVSDIGDFVATDRFGDGGVEITALAEEGPVGGAKTRSLVICGVGPSSVPGCAYVGVAALGPVRGAGTHLYRVSLGCDGALDLTGWEGGVQIRPVHTRGRIKFP